MPEPQEDLEITPDNQPDARPEWLPNNFQTPEDLAKSYKSSVQKITEQGTELSQLRTEMEEIKSAQTQRSQQSENDDIQTQIMEAFESGDGRAAAGAASYLAKLAVEQAMAEFKPEIPAHFAEDRAALAHQELSARYSDWQEISPEIGQLISDDPSVLSVTASTPLKDVVRQLDRAYKLVKYDKGQTTQTEAATNLDELNRQVKNAAQTMTGSSSATEAETEWDRIKAARSGIPPVRL